MVFGRPRHVEDRRKLVRSLHLPDRCRHNPPLVLPVYLFIFAGGLLALFVVFVIMYVAGISQWVCVGFGVTSASATVWLTFHLNAKYGEHGLMKLAAVKYRPRYIINRLRLKRLINVRK